MNLRSGYASTKFYFPQKLSQKSIAFLVWKSLMYGTDCIAIPYLTEQNF